MADNTNNKRRIVICGKGGGQAESVDWNDIENKPEFATVATSGDYDDLTNKPTIPAAQVNSDWNANSGVSQILNKPNLATVATSGSYSDLSNTPNLATVATSGDYDDLTNKPTIPAAQVNSDWNANSGVSQILNKPSLATVATSGDYDDLTNKPTIPTVPTNVSAFTNDAGYLTQHQSLAGYATEQWVENKGYSTFSGDYDDLTNKPTIPAAQVNSDWNANSGVEQILNKPTLATVATSGSYNDLTDKPTIPAAPVQSNWNESDSTSLAYIQNKPTIPAAQVNSDWNASSGVSQILNKPAMTTETLTFTLQGGTTQTITIWTQPTV